MKPFLLALLALVTFSPRVLAATTINLANRSACGANLGWLDWRGAEFELE